MRIAARHMISTVLLLAVISAGHGQDAKIAVLNPRGNPPPVPLAPMAPRLPGLDGKTIYFLDIKYEGGASLLRAIMDWFTANMPATNLVFREKAGSYDQEDAKLWAEIKERGDAVVVAGGETKAVFQAGNLKYVTSVAIDPWR